MARDGYTLLDYFSDIGGIEDFLFSTTAIFLVWWNHNNFDNFLASKLYRIASEKHRKEHEILVPQGMRDPLDFICDKLPKKCQCCQGSRKTRSFIVARERLHQEINMFDQVRDMRYFKKALKLLLSPKDR